MPSASAGRATVSCRRPRPPTVFASRPSFAPDIVVTDIKLPGEMDGLDLTETLKQDISKQALPVVILTGCAFEQDREQANRAGCDRFLTKPCLPEVLATSIEEVLREYRFLGGKPTAVEGV